MAGRADTSEERDRPDAAGDRTHTGLGLSIARTIVHGFGFAITAENRAGGGSCFVIRLPSTRALP